MSVVLVLVPCLLFGAADQYLGSLSAHPWAADVSLLSAPWLVLPFTVGLGQRSPRRAAVMGAAATLLALTGYGLMTLSPVENARFSLDAVDGFLVRSGSYRWFVAGLLTGPLFAWLGHRWRVRRGWAPVVTVGLVVSLEPAAHLLAGSGIRSSAVTVGEVAAGVGALVCYAVWRAAAPAVRSPGRSALRF